MKTTKRTAADFVAKKVAFGGSVDNVQFNGEILDFEDFDSISTYHGTVKEGQDPILMGYIVVDEDTDEVVQFVWEEQDALDYAQDEENSCDYKVLSVILTRAMFNEYIKDRQDRDDEIENHSAI